ncbi:MAG: helix-turn-helix domain-containing protein [Clostridia bacterium]|nr:helix-turn-helix domain-containing protein [Clostridia bacterium]
MYNRDFNYSSIEVTCSDLKIVFITDDKSSVADGTAVHMHSFFELFYLTEGHLTLTSEGKSTRLEKGEMLLIPPSTYHSSEFSPDAVKRSVFFTFCKTKADGERIFDRVNTAFTKAGIRRITDSSYPAMLFDAILELSVKDKLAAVWRARAYVSELVFSLCERIEGRGDEPAALTSTPNTYWVYKYAIERLLDIYYKDDITLEFLGEKLYLSPQNVTRIISAAYGKSFNELKGELKMRNAKKMLAETELSVNEIGERIGYSSARGFLAAFRKYEGCTPSEYRRERLDGKNNKNR